MERGPVFVIGAGPAGLFAARKIAAAGHRVAIFNRDVKPGGLAEYGIYPQKFHMKGGLRKQFTKILDMPNVDYYGNLQIGEQAALSIGGLRDWNPAAMVFAVGAQGTKKLGLPAKKPKASIPPRIMFFTTTNCPPSLPRISPAVAAWRS